MLSSGLAGFVLAQAAQSPCAQPAPGALDDTTKLIIGALLTLATGIVGFTIGQAIQYARTRTALLIGLKLEAITAKEAVSKLLVHAEKTLPQAEALLKSVKGKTLTFEQLNALASGFMLYVPTYSVIDTISKMKRWGEKRTEDDIRKVILYLDRWSTVCLVEKSYSAAHAKLVELSPKIADDTEQARIQEAADQVHCCLKELIARFKKLLDAAREVEALKVGTLKA